MSEPTDPEIVRDGDFPVMAFRVWAPEEAWRQEDGRPGYVDFVVCEVVATEMDGTACYNKPGWVSSMEYSTHEIDEADWFARGSVKWDGCVNWSTNDADCMHHHCDANGLHLSLAAIERAYAKACEILGLTP